MTNLCWLALLACSLGALATPTSEAKAAKSKPHILFLLADDLGWANIGFHRTNATSEDEKQGQLEVQTPTINKLVKEGARDLCVAVNRDPCKMR